MTDATEKKTKAKDIDERATPVQSESSKQHAPAEATADKEKKPKKEKKEAVAAAPAQPEAEANPPIEEEKQLQAVDEVAGDTPASRTSAKAPAAANNMAKAESQTTPADGAGPTKKELPKQDSIPEENMPKPGQKDLAQADDNSSEQAAANAAVQRNDSIPEENMPQASPERDLPVPKQANINDDGAAIPEENMPAADYQPSTDKANEKPPSAQQ